MNLYGVFAIESVSRSFYFFYTFPQYHSHIFGLFRKTRFGYTKTWLQKKSNHLNGSFLVLLLSVGFWWHFFPPDDRPMFNIETLVRSGTITSFVSLRYIDNIDGNTHAQVETHKQQKGKRTKSTVMFRCAVCNVQFPSCICIIHEMQVIHFLPLLILIISYLHNCLSVCLPSPIRIAMNITEFTELNFYILFYFFSSPSQFACNAGFLFI